MKTHTLRMLLSALVLLGAMICFAPAVLADPAPDDTSNPPCTSFTERMSAMDSDTSTTGLLSDIYGYISEVVSGATEKLFSAFTDSSIYQGAVFASMALMILYGIGFTVGLVQASFAEVLKRLLKIGIIGTLVSSAGWGFFSAYVVNFFNNGTDDIIKGVMTIGTGTPVPDGATPFLPPR